MFLSGQRQNLYSLLLHLQHCLFFLFSEQSYFGIAAPTEAAAVGAVVATLLTVAYKRFSWKVLMDVSLSTIKLTGMVLLIASCSTTFVSVFLSAGGGGVVESFIMGFPGGRWAVFAMIMVVCFILGAFIDSDRNYFCNGSDSCSYCTKTWF